VSAIILTLLLIGMFWAGALIAHRRYDLKRRGIEVAPGFLMWRTTRGLKFIDRAAKACRKGWLAYGTVAATTGIILMVFIFTMVALSARIILSHPSESPPGVVIAYPGFVPGLEVLPWLVAISLLLLVHEFSHGLVLRAQGLKTKSVGVLLLLAVPGAFVEPDEEQLRRAPISKRLRVYGAGSFGNFLLAFLCLGLLLFCLSPKDGIYVYGIAKGYPAENVLTPGMRILALDNWRVDNYEELHNFMSTTVPGQIVRISTDRGEYSVKLARDPDSENRGYLGIWPVSAVPESRFVNPLFDFGAAAAIVLGRLAFDHQLLFHPYVYDSLVPWGVVDIIKWTFVLNLLVGLFNLLPAVPLDGGYILQGLVEKVSSPKVAKRVSYAFSMVVLVLIIIGFLPKVI